MSDGVREPATDSGVTRSAASRASVDGAAPWPSPVQALKPTRYTKRRPNPATVYLESLARGRSRQTMAGHVRNLALLASGGAVAWDRFPWARLNYQGAQRIRHELGERYAPAGANLRLAALRRILSEAFNLGQMRGDAYHRARQVHNFRGDSAPRGRSLEPEEVATLVQTARGRGDLKGIRDAAIFALLFGTGLRRRELVRIAWPADIDLERRTITVGTKGARHRTVDLQAPVAQALEHWLKRRGDAEGPLFVGVNRYSQQGETRLTPEAIGQLCNVYGERAGLRRFTPHDFRRTFAVELLDAGVELHTVGEMLDHRDLKTTARYDPQRDRRRVAAAARLRCLF